MPTSERSLGRATDAAGVQTQVTRKNTDGADHSADQSHIPGGAKESDPLTSYLRTVDKCNLTIVDVQTAITIGGGAADDTYLKGIRIYVALTGTLVIDGFEGSAGAAISRTLPAATPAGFYNFKGALNSKGALIVTASNAADDNNIDVLWWPA